MHNILITNKKIRFSVVFALTLPSTIALAGAPVTYDSWRMDNNGKITAPCPEGYSCKAPMSDKGMFQQMLIDKRGKRYIQTIVHDKDAQGVMSLESFVALDTGMQTNSGIAARQVFDLNSDYTDLKSTVELSLGWAASDEKAEIIIDSSLFNTSRKQGGFGETFRYEGERDALGNDQGAFLAIRQELSNFAGKNKQGKAYQAFETRIASGTRVASAGSVLLDDGGIPEYYSGRRGPNNENDNSDGASAEAPAVCGRCKGPAADPNPGPGVGGPGPGEGAGGREPSSMATSNASPSFNYNYNYTPDPDDPDGMNAQIGGSYGGETTWNAGDKVQTIWIGQNMGKNVGQFSFQTYDNLSDSEAAIANRTLLDANPQAWDENLFGSAPTLNNN